MAVRGGRQDCVAGINDDIRSQLTHVDRRSGAFGGINHAHARIHEGWYFTAADYDDEIDEDEPKNYAITTPAGIPEEGDEESSSSSDSSSSSSSSSGAAEDDAEYHFAFSVETSHVAAVRLYEAAEVHGGADVPIHNNNRLSTRNSRLTIARDVIVDTPGTLLDVFLTGTASRTGSSSPTSVRDEVEFILKRDTTYLITITPIADDTHATFRTGHYEFIATDVDPERQWPNRAHGE